MDDDRPIDQNRMRIAQAGTPATAATAPLNGQSLARTRPPPSEPPAPLRRSGPPDELDVLIRARYPVIYVVTWEEERVEQRLAKTAEAGKKNLYVWTCPQGIVRWGSNPQPAKSGSGNTADPLAALDAVL